MAIFKPMIATRAALEKYVNNEGYVYFCIDDGSFHIDFKDAEGTLQRKQINAATLTSLLDSAQVAHGTDQILLATIIENYILNIDYANTLAFDVSEIIVENNNSGTSAILGTCILGQMILA